MLLQQTPNGVAHDHSVSWQQYLDGPSIPNEKEQECGHTISNSRLFVRWSTDRVPLSGKGTSDFGMQYNGRWENEKISGYFLVWGKRTSVGGSGTNDGAREGVRRCPAAQGFGRVRGSGSPHRQQHVFRTKLNGWPAQCMANRKG